MLLLNYIVIFILNNLFFTNSNKLNSFVDFLLIILINLFITLLLMLIESPACALSSLSKSLYLEHPRHRIIKII